MNAQPITIISNANLLLPEDETFFGVLILEGNRILEIASEIPGSMLLNEQNVMVVDAEGHYLSAGLIETHFNGALGCNLNSAGIQDVHQLLLTLPRRGITSCLLTAISAPQEDLITTIHVLEEAIHHRVPHATRILGLHLEGPFIHPDFRGAHPENGLHALTMENLQLLLSPNVKLITMAPELDPEGACIQYLTERDIRVSAGHTNATYEEMQDAIEYGVTSVTHIFNAMRPFHHREPGISTAALNDDDIFVQVIGDGAHVHPGAVEMVIYSKGIHRTILVSDSYPMAGMPEGAETTFGRQRITIQNGQALNEEGRLVGGNLLLDDCVRNLVDWDACTFSEAVRMATSNPAEFLGVDDQVGYIEPGYFADLTLWNKDTFAIEATWLNGHQVFGRQPAHPLAP
ncbi:MAG: N-acetylglucosamine-6-phosphate deacetylase [Candidatus Melainabacteria bacterium]